MKILDCTLHNLG